MGRTSSRRREAAVHEIEELLAAPPLLHSTALLEVAVEEARDLARPGHGAQLHGEEGLHPHAVLLAGAPRDEGLEEGAHAPGIPVQSAALVDPVDQGAAAPTSPWRAGSQPARAAIRAGGRPDHPRDRGFPGSSAARACATSR